MKLTEKDLLVEFVLNSLETSFGKFKHNFSECKRHFSEESVHDFRVSMRRFMALLDLLNQVYPRKYLLDIRKILKKELKVFNPLRDNQVQILNLRSLIYTYPALFTYYVKQLHDEQIFINQIKVTLDDLSIHDIEGLMFFIMMDMKDRLRKEQGGFSGMFTAAKQSFDSLIEKRNDVDIKNLETVHKLRIAFKKFRYVVEMLFPYIHYPKEILKRLKGMQNILGEIQDNRVFFAQVSIFISESETSLQEFYKKPLQDILAKRNKLLTDLSDCLGNIDTLWNEEYFKIKKHSSSKENEKK